MDNNLFDIKYGKSSIVKDLIFSFIALTLVFCSMFVTQFWFSLCKVQGDSMFPTLKNNDVLVIDKLSKIERYDVVVFTRKDSSLVKRVIAFEGESVFCTDGELYIKKTVNGNEVIKKLNEPYLKGLKTPNFEERKVSKNQIFVLGDNRYNSTDSLDFGPISIDDVQGVVHDFFIKNKSTTTKIFG